MTLSFVIPAYNAEPYIQRCLKSIMPLLSKDTEAIVVNDGSTDLTPSIVQSLSNANPHIHLVNQTNQGQSVARNVGLSHAQGDYIWFVDSDDYIDTQQTKPVIEALSTNEYDLIVIGRLDENEQGCKQTQRLWKGTYPTACNYFRDSIRKGAYRTQPWDKIVKRNILVEHQILFEPHRMFEDMLHGLRIMLHAQKTLLLPLYPYHYLLCNPNSLTRQVRINDLDAIFFTDKAARLLNEGHYPLRATDGAFLTLVFTFLSSCLLKKYIPLATSNTEAQKMVDAVMTNPLFLHAAQYCATHRVGMSRTLLAQLICLSPSLYQILIRIALRLFTSCT